MVYYCFYSKVDQPPTLYQQKPCLKKHTLNDSWEKCPRPANMASDPVKLEEALENRKIGIKFDFINHQVKK